MKKANKAVRERAKELGIAIGFKDIGGGGLACGSSEICAAGGFGVQIDLDAVHVGLPNLLPETITCAETQERYVLAVPGHFTAEVLRIYNEDWDLPNIYEGACARVIGKITTEKTYHLTWQNKIVCDAPVDAVTSGISYEREEQPRTWDQPEPEFEMPEDMNETLLGVLAHRNICSRAYVYREYDTEVQGNAVIRPGEAGAGLCAPLEGSTAGVALAVDGNPFYGLIDPYWGGATAVAEAMRNVAAIGATPAALTDCLNFGNPEKPQAFWEFRQGVKGLADAARNIGLKGHPGHACPIISGNVSFYNESATGGAVAPSPIIACVGTMQDYSKAITMQFKQPDSAIYLVGPRRDELGGSAYYQALGLGLGANVPKVDWELERGMIFGVIDAIEAGCVNACTDISDGGLVVALCEMILGGFANGKLGAEIELPLSNDLRTDKLLFSESSGFVIECRPGREAELEKIFSDYGVETARIGEVDDDPKLAVKVADQDVLELGIDKIRDAWLNGLARTLA